MIGGVSEAASVQPPPGRARLRLGGMKFARYAPDWCLSVVPCHVTSQHPGYLQTSAAWLHVRRDALSIRQSCQLTSCSCDNVATITSCVIMLANITSFVTSWPPRHASSLLLTKQCKMGGLFGFCDIAWHYVKSDMWTDNSYRVVSKIYFCKNVLRL